VEEAVGEKEESNSRSCWIRRSFVSKGHEESSIAIKLPYSSSHTTMLLLNMTKASVTNLEVSEGGKLGIFFSFCEV
jgi:hypothetical protein